MTEQERIKEVESLDIWDKLKVYWDYYVEMLFVQHNFSYTNTFARKDKWVANGFVYCENFTEERVKPFVFGQIIKNKSAFKIPTFDEFISKDNIKTVDVGENWKENKFAQRSWTTLNVNSIYHYYLIYKNK